MKIADSDDLEFMAAVIFFFIVRSGETRAFMIARRLGHGYNDSYVKNMLDNWRDNEFWDGQRFTLDITGDPLHDTIEFTLFCMTGAGTIQRIQVFDEAEEKEIKEPPLLKAV